jgi:hypothetical protein
LRRRFVLPAARGQATRLRLSTALRDRWVDRRARYGSNNGFDHVFQAPDGTVTVLLDSKQLPAGAATLSTEGAGGATQLSDAWVTNVLNKLDPASPAWQAVSQAQANGTLVKGVIGVERVSGNLSVVRVK